jgi:hypothetical protein
MITGHSKWCPRKDKPANVSGKYCSTCGKQIKVAPNEAER